MKNNILTLLLFALVIPFTKVSAREKQVFPPKYYAMQKHDGGVQPSIVAAHPDDIYWTDVSSLSGGLINFAYQIKVCNDALYVLGQDNDQYAVIGRYTKKDGWKIVCDIDVYGTIHTFSVDSDYIYIGGNFTTAGSQKIPTRNIVRFNSKSKTWHPMGEGLWNPKEPDDFEVIEHIEAFKGLVFIRGRFTHSGDKEFDRGVVYWNGKVFVEDDKFNYADAVRHNDIFYNFGCSVDSSNNVRLNLFSWDGANTIHDTKDSKLDISVKGILGGSGFGIDSKKNYYIKGDYDVSSTDSTPHKYGTCFLGYIDNKWELLGGKNWCVNEKYYDDIIAEVDADGQVYASGILREGIGVDKLFKNKYMQIVYWNGVEWVSMGSGISNFPRISTIKYYDGDVYVGGFSGFSMAGDKPTNGFAKWSKKRVSAVAEQPLTTILEVSLSPNPARDHMTVELDNETTDCTITLYDLYGSSVGSYSVGGRRSTINTDHLSSGVYTLRVQYGERIASKTIAIIR